MFKFYLHHHRLSGGSGDDGSDATGRGREKKMRKVCTTLLKDETSKRKYFAITRERGSVQLHTAQIIRTLNMSMNVLKRIVLRVGIMKSHYYCCCC